MNSDRMRQKGGFNTNYSETGCIKRSAFRTVEAENLPDDACIIGFTRLEESFDEDDAVICVGSKNCLLYQSGIYMFPDSALIQYYLHTADNKYVAVTKNDLPVVTVTDKKRKTRIQMTGMAGALLVCAALLATRFSGKPGKELSGATEQAHTNEHSIMQESNGLPEDGRLTDDKLGSGFGSPINDADVPDKESGKENSADSAKGKTAESDASDIKNNNDSDGGSIGDEGYKSYSSKRNKEEIELLGLEPVSSQDRRRSSE